MTHPVFNEKYGKVHNFLRSSTVVAELRRMEEMRVDFEDGRFVFSFLVIPPETSHDVNGRILEAKEKLKEEAREKDITAEISTCPGGDEGTFFITVMPT